MQYRVFEVGEKGAGSMKRYKLYRVATKPTNSWERANFDIARFATPEEAAEAIEKDAAYPGDCIIVACVS